MKTILFLPLVLSDQARERPYRGEDLKDTRDLLRDGEAGQFLEELLYYQRAGIEDGDIPGRGPYVAKGMNVAAGSEAESPRLEAFAIGPGS